MATTYKVLGQANPAATTATTLYTVPSATSAVVSTITVAGLTGGGTFRISVRPGGAVQANQHYLVYDAAIGAGETIALTLGVTLATTDVITVYSNVATLAFQAFGSELS